MGVSLVRVLSGHDDTYVDYLDAQQTSILRTLQALWAVAWANASGACVRGGLPELLSILAESAVGGR